MFTWIRRLMARPRSVQLPCGGEMILKNVPKENADAIQALVLKSPQGVMPTVVDNTGNTVEVINNNIMVEATRSFSLKALTTRQNPDTLKYELISVEIDPDTQETGNIVVLSENSNKNEIKAAFKIAAVTMGVV